jgi:enamine deaminase RidA (YjgF/YER057c/UK114 family)
MGYSRAVRVGSWICVSGTTATDSDGKLVGKNDPYLQTVRTLQNIETALKNLGSSLDDVVRTRIYVKNIDDWKKVAKGHAEYLGQVKPTTSMVEVSRFIDSSILVEIEVDAISAN